MRRRQRPGSDIDGVPVLITGASEGGAVTTLAAERYPGVFQGALSTCGPTGNFQKQLDYFGDFNVLFNYFFPGVFHGVVTPVGVSADVMAHWLDTYQPAARAAVAANPSAASRLVKVAGAPVDPADPDGLWNTIESILWYNVFATNDAIAKLGGQPFDNTRRWYFGLGGGPPAELARPARPGRRGGASRRWRPTTRRPAISRCRT